MNKQVVQVWGEGRSQLWTPDGPVIIPADYSEVPVGNSGRTRLIGKLTQEQDQVLYIRMRKRSQWNQKLAVLAPSRIIEQADAMLAASAKQRELKRSRAVEERHHRHLRDCEESRMTLLAIFPSMPPCESREIIEHAFEVGSGRVGRNRSLDDDKRLLAATIAHIRHTHTDYDELLEQGIEQPEARSIVGPRIRTKLDEWKTTQPEAISG